MERLLCIYGEVKSLEEDPMFLVSRICFITDILKDSLNRLN